MLIRRTGLPSALTALALVISGVACFDRTSVASAAEPRTRLQLTRETQPKPQRPRLEALKAGARLQGITLEAAIDRLAAGVRPEGDATRPDLKIDDLSLAELDDLRTWSKQRGRPLAEMIERHGWENRFVELAAQIFARHPGQRTGAAIVDTPDGGRGAWLGFKGAVPDDAVALARTLAAPVELVGNTGYTEDELEQELARAMADKSHAVPVNGAYDVRSGVITLTLTSSPAGKSAQSDFRPVAPLNPRVRVEVVRSELPAGEMHDGWLRGGGRLDYNGAWGYCTVGYNIYKGSLRSPSTAGHCSWSSAQNALTYYNHASDGGSTTIQHKLTHVGAEGDFARYGPGGLTSTDTYYADWSVKRYVERVASYDMTNVYGKLICHFGVTTNASCGSVHSVGFTESYQLGGQWASIGRLVTLDDGTSDHGDSGGPWYWGTDAYGINHGYCNEGGTYRVCFSQARFIPNALDGWKVVLH